MLLHVTWMVCSKTNFLYGTKKRNLKTLSFHSFKKYRMIFFQWTWPIFVSISVTVPRSGELRTHVKVPSGENTDLKGSPFEGWSRSVHSHTCYAYCQGSLLYLYLPFRSIHLHFFQNLSHFFPVLAVANTGSCVGPQNKIGHPVGCRFPCWVPAEYK